MAAFEKATAVERPDGTSGAAGETLPVFKSDDSGRTWQRLSAVPAPADLSHGRRYARYTSNWTNPFLYTLPERVGDLAALFKSSEDGATWHFVNIDRGGRLAGRQRGRARAASRKPTAGISRGTRFGSRI